jgi:hypothetical protein
MDYAPLLPEAPMGNVARVQFLGDFTRDADNLTPSGRASRASPRRRNTAPRIPYLTYPPTGNSSSGAWCGSSWDGDVLHVMHVRRRTDR